MDSQKQKLLVVILFVLALGVWKLGWRLDWESTESNGATQTAPQGKDQVDQEIHDFRYSTRDLYNNRRFDQLEALATQLRTTKARFGNSTWKLFHFYDSLGCSDSDPESLWLLHDEIHKDWIAKKPESITARVAYADFLKDYAWKARGSGWASSVSKEGWRLFAQRLAESRRVLEESARLKDKCPYAWEVMMTVAIGQDWDRANFEKLFREAKSVEPEYWCFDVKRAKYLLPRWHGNPGDWEQAASQEMLRPGSLGAEGYALVVIAQSYYYDNIFTESKASLPDTLRGLQILRQKHPNSLEILSQYCRMASLGGERALARQLFDQIDNRREAKVWTAAEFTKSRNWAYAP